MACGSAISLWATGGCTEVAVSIGSGKPSSAGSGVEDSGGGAAADSGGVEGAIGRGER